jgi:hypothetical protein
MVYLFFCTGDVGENVSCLLWKNTLQGRRGFIPGITIAIMVAFRP